MREWWRHQSDSVQGVIISVGIVGVLFLFKVGLSKPPIEFWVIGATAVVGVVSFAPALPAWARATGIALTIVGFLGSVYVMVNKDNTWRVETIERQRLTGLLKSTLPERRYTVHFFWLKSNDQTLSFIRELAQIFADNGWNVNPNPAGDILRDVAPVTVVTSNEEQTSRPENSVHLKRMLDDAGIRNIWGAEDQLKRGEVGIAVSKPPSWKWSDIWQ